MPGVILCPACGTCSSCPAPLPRVPAGAGCRGHRSTGRQVFWMRTADFRPASSSQSPGRFQADIEFRGETMRGHGALPCLRSRPSRPSDLPSRAGYRGRPGKRPEVVSMRPIAKCGGCGACCRSLTKGAPSARRHDCVSAAGVVAPPCPDTPGRPAVSRRGDCSARAVRVPSRTDRFRNADPCR